MEFARLIGYSLIMMVLPLVMFYFGYHEGIRQERRNRYVKSNNNNYKGNYMNRR